MSAELVKSLAETYTESELRERITALTQELVEQPFIYTAGSSGGGVNYQRQERMKLEERLDLLRRALRYKEGDAGAVEVVGRAKIVFR